MSLVVGPTSSLYGLSYRCYFCQSISRRERRLNFNVVRERATGALVEGTLSFTGKGRTTFTFRNNRPALTKLSFFGCFIHAIGRLGAGRDPIFFDVRAGNAVVASR